MIIDAHNHPDWWFITREKFVEDMDRNGIDKTWLLSCEMSETDYNPADKIYYTASAFNGGTAIPFERAIPYAEKYPERFILGFAPNPKIPGAVRRLEQAVKTYGVKVCGEMKFRMLADDYDAIELYRWCGENGLPVVMHLELPFPCSSGEYPRQGYWYNGTIDALERAMKAAPDTVFVGHAPAFWAEISGDGLANKVSYPTGKVLPGGKLIKLLDKYKNLYCDISAGSGLNGISRDREFGKKFLNDYRERILYARDSFRMNHKKFLLSLGLEQETLDCIFYKNALRLTHDDK